MGGNFRCELICRGLRKAAHFTLRNKGYPLHHRNPEQRNGIGEAENSVVMEAAHAGSRPVHAPWSLKTLSCVWEYRSYPYLDQLSKKWSSSQVSEYGSNGMHLVSLFSQISNHFWPIAKEFKWNVNSSICSDHRCSHNFIAPNTGMLQIFWTSPAVPNRTTVTVNAAIYHSL